MSPVNIRHRARSVAFCIAGCAAIAAVACADMVDRFHPPPLARALDLSVEVTDRAGAPLRVFTNAAGRWRLAADLDAVDPRFVAMLIAYEDKRFWRHGGVDPLAMARALWQAVVHGRAVSGASTITMQLAALLEPDGRGTMAGKLRQIVRAWQIERRLSKREILERYLTLAPYGGNLEGVRAAALAYFGRTAAHLPPADAALLVALPQAPEARRPDRNPKTARAARDRVLDRMVTAGVLEQAVADAGRGRSSPTRRRAMPAIAAHLSERLHAASPRERIIATTLDRSLQATLEDLVVGHVRQWGPRVSSAILVAEHGTGRIRAHVGSAGYLDGRRSGAIDMARAVRSPGSTLKPFIYGLAFDSGLAHPETLIEDRPSRFAAYAPRNFDLTFQGTVTVREALAQSLNVPAVALLDAVGPQRLLTHLERAGIAPTLPENKPAGLAIGLGGLGLTLEDLTRLYVALGRGGQPVDLTHMLTSSETWSETDRQPVLTPRGAWQVTDILRSTPPPAAAAGGRIAFKTGTSYGFRDAWSVGYDGKHVVAVWLGRPDGAPVTGLTGRAAAAPLLFDAFARLADRPAPLDPPAGLDLTSDPPPGLDRFERELTPANVAPAAPLAIAFPPDGARLRVNGTAERAATTLRAEGGLLPLAWFADGRPIGISHRRRSLEWSPDGPGYTTISIVDGAGTTTRARIFVEDRMLRAETGLLRPRQN